MARELALNSTGKVTIWNKHRASEEHDADIHQAGGPEEHPRYNQGEAQRRAQVGDGQDRVPQVERHVAVGVLDRVADLVRCHGQTG